MYSAPRASNGPYHLGLRALQEEDIAGGNPTQDRLGTHSTQLSRPAADQHDQHSTFLGTEIDTAPQRDGRGGRDDDALAERASAPPARSHAQQQQADAAQSPPPQSSLLFDAAEGGDELDALDRRIRDLQKVQDSRRHELDEYMDDLKSRQLQGEDEGLVEFPPVRRRPAPHRPPGATQQSARIHGSVMERRGVVVCRASRRLWRAWAGRSWSGRGPRTCRGWGRSRR